MSAVTSAYDDLAVVDKPIMSTQAIVFIALASASAAFTIGAGIWCVAYGALGRKLRRTRAREDTRAALSSSVRGRPISAPETDPGQEPEMSESYFRLPWLTISQSRTHDKKTTPDLCPSPTPSSVSSLNLQKLYPISPALLSVQAGSPNAQVITQSAISEDTVLTPHVSSTLSTKSLDLKKLWPISPSMLSQQSSGTQMSIRSAMSEQDLNRVNVNADTDAGNNGKDVGHGKSKTASKATKKSHR